MIGWLVLLLTLCARFFINAPNWIPLGAVLMFLAATNKSPWATRGAIAIAIIVDDAIAAKMGYEGLSLGMGLTIGLLYLLVVLMGDSAYHFPTFVFIPTMAMTIWTGMFFVATNFYVWSAWNMYPHSLSGLWQCYAAAVPFYRGTAISNTLAACLLFGTRAFFEGRRAHEPEGEGIVTGAGGGDH